MPSNNYTSTNYTSTNYKNAAKTKSDLRALLRIRTGLAFYDDKLTELWNNELRPSDYLLNELQQTKQLSMMCMKYTTEAVLSMNTNFLDTYREALIYIENAYIDYHDMINWQTSHSV